MAGTCANRLLAIHSGRKMVAGTLIPGVSQRMLTQSLRKLEGEGLVSRQVFDTVPPMVEYTLTPLGETMLEPLAAIQRWVCTHFQTR